MSNPDFKLTFTESDRGFRLIAFEDYYGKMSKVAESSLAADAAIWIGLAAHPIQLTQGMVKELIPLLQHFVKTGRLPGEPEANGSANGLDFTEEELHDELKKLGFKIHMEFESDGPSKPPGESFICWDARPGHFAVLPGGEIYLHVARCNVGSTLGVLPPDLEGAVKLFLDNVDHNGSVMKPQADPVTVEAKEVQFEHQRVWDVRLADLSRLRSEGWMLVDHTGLTDGNQPNYLYGSALFERAYTAKETP